MSNVIQLESFYDHAARQMHAILETVRAVQPRVSLGSSEHPFCCVHCRDEMSLTQGSSSRKWFVSHRFNPYCKNSNRFYPSADTREEAVRNAFEPQ